MSDNLKERIYGWIGNAMLCDMAPTPRYFLIFGMTWCAVLVGTEVNWILGTIMGLLGSLWIFFACHQVRYLTIWLLKAERERDELRFKEKYDEPNHRIPFAK